MKGGVRTAVVGLACAVSVGAPTTAAAVDPADGFRSVLVPGQGETVDAGEFGAYRAGAGPPRSFVDQVGMYRDLLYAEPQLTGADLDRLFKPATVALGDDQAVSVHRPRPGAVIRRDRFGVPHVSGQTRSDVMFGAGYATAQDRLFFMDVVRHAARARLSELLGPGKRDANLRTDARQLLTLDYSEEELQGQLDGLAALGDDGRQVHRDTLDYTSGVNRYIEEALSEPGKLPVEYAGIARAPSRWRPTDSVAIAALIGAVEGGGGGAETTVAAAWSAALQRFGPRTGRRVAGDFLRLADAEAPPTAQRAFPSQRLGAPDPRAVALPDAGSLRPRDPLEPDGVGAGRLSAGAQDRTVLAPGLRLPETQSYALLVAGRRSSTGRPIGVLGSAVGYTAPALLQEIALDGPGIAARGVTFPGLGQYVLIGRGRNFAWAIPSSLTDDTDEFVERLCEPDGSQPSLSADHYVRHGRCVPLEVRSHVLTIPPSPGHPSARTVRMRVERSVHGPIQARGTVGGRPVAVAEARSSYGHDIQSAIAIMRLNRSDGMTARRFVQTVAPISLVRTWMYADDRDLAFVQSGWFPLRARGTDPRLPTWGTGRWDWVGFDPATFTSARVATKRLPHQVGARRGYLVNWNNTPARGWRMGDGVISHGSVHRVGLLEGPLRATLRQRRRVTPVDLVRIAERAATADLRARRVLPWVRRVLGRLRDPEREDVLRRMDAWIADGAHRRDLDRDGFYEHSAAIAVLDAWWPRIVRAVFAPVLGEELIDRLRSVDGFGSPPSPVGNSFSTGWWSYVHKDLRTLLGRQVRGRFSRVYCGGGRRGRCRTALAAALRDAIETVRRQRGERIADWAVPATCPSRRPPICDQLEFTPVGAVEVAPIPWQNRPTFQQLVGLR